MIAFLEERGFVCTRSAASKGSADIIAIGQWRVLRIQNKAYRLSLRQRIRLKDTMNREVPTGYYSLTNEVCSKDWEAELKTLLNEE